MAEQELSLAQITELMSKSRQKGVGEAALQEFLDSGKQGIVVDLKSGRFAGKNANQVQATLNNAKNRTRKTADGVEVVNPQFDPIMIKKAGKGDDAVVALINTSLVDLNEPETETE